MYEVSKLKDVKLDLSELKREIDKEPDTKLYYKMSSLWDKFVLLYDDYINIESHEDLLEECEDKEYEIGLLEDEIVDLREDIINFENEVSSLKSDIDNFEDEVGNLKTDLQDKDNETEYDDETPNK